MQRYRQVIVTIGLLLIACLVMVWVLTSRSDRVIHQWTQPSTIDYQSFDPYHLLVVEGAREWRTVGFPRRHYVFIGREPDPTTYGHRLDYTFHPGSDDIDTHIGKTTVVWTDTGVTFTEASGHQLFIPKAMFIGGR